MASLNLSLNGQSIKSSLNRLVDRNPSSSSPADFAYWTLLTVTAPLAGLSFDTTARESILKVESTGEGELKEMFDEFNDGRIQYAYVKVKDPNTGLPKCLFIAWCGDGVPERTKGYFTTYTAAIAKMLPGYHVQVTARSENDLEVAAVMKKIMDASSSKYSSVSGEQAESPRAPTLKPKPVFTPTMSSSGRLVDPLIAARSRRDANLDEGWGADAPPVTRTGIEKVDSAYRPTRVNMAELTKSKPEPGRYASNGKRGDSRNATVGGSYQPVGKVDIAAIRAAVKKQEDDRPAPVKGAYEPVGKVDIAAIRARAQKPVEEAPEQTPAPQPVADRAAAFSQPAQAERITSLPKPKVGRKFGGASAFSGTKAPTPGGLGFGAPAVPAAPPVGAASRTFADQGGKTPAQLWAEKKAKERVSNVGEASVPSASSGVASQHSGGGGQWKSGYTGKSWAPVQTSGYGVGATESTSRQTTGEAPNNEDAQETPASSVSALRGRFKDAPPMGAAASSDRPSEPGPRPSRGIQDSSKPAGGFGLPGLPNRPPPPTDDEQEEMDMHDATGGRDASPIRVAVPVARSSAPMVKREEEPAPQRIPPQQVPVPREEQLQDDDEAEQVARGAAKAVADQSFEPERATVHHLEQGGKRALIQYNYEKAEDNEIELVEGEYVSNIDMVDDDWWLGTNSKGESGLFPSNYVELVEEEQQPQSGSAPTRAAGGGSTSQPHSTPAPPAPAEASAGAAHGGRTATALYDYEAAEENELSFPEDAKIEGVEFPDEDWWFGHCGGRYGLFPANYVQLDE